MGRKHSEATREKMSVAARNRPARSAETIEKWRKSRAGYVTSATTRLKISATSKGRVMPADARRRISEAQRGRKHAPVTEATRVKLRELGLKRTFSLVTRERIRQSKLGKKHTPETRAAMRKGARERRIREREENKLLAPKKLLRKDVETIWQYDDWRRRVFMRDNFTCRGCDTHGGYLNAHHIEHMKALLKRYTVLTIEQAIACVPLWDIDNGITLCTVCHHRIHGFKDKEVTQ